MKIHKSKLPLVLAASIVLLLSAGYLWLVYNKTVVHDAKLVMGATLLEPYKENDSSKQAAADLNLEKYFRPSKLPILNIRSFPHDSLFQVDQDGPYPPEKANLPKQYFKSPEDTILNYFSILRQAANLTDEKTGGCGTVGDWLLPFPFAYRFFTSEYQQKVNYDEYLKSFEGIGHTNLIKLKALPADQVHPKDDRYFVELETIEGSDKGVTYFAYYFGFVYIQKQGDQFMISDIQLMGEDFLCAPYHGWWHNAEDSVDIRFGDWCKMIEERYPTKQQGYTKKVPFKGRDGSNYIIEFMQLTNDTDFEVAQYKQGNDGKWNVVYMNPSDCVDKKQ